MTKACYLTGRRTKSGSNRSYAIGSIKRTVKFNLRKVRVMAGGKPKKVWASTRALKPGKVERV